MRTSLIATALLAAAGVVYGCGSDSEDGSNDTTGAGSSLPGDAGTGGTGSSAALKVAFSPMYSAFDGVHEFKLPVIVDEDGGAGAKFEASDPSYVDIDKTAEGAMLTMRKSGEVTITATLGDRKGTAKLSIAKASAGDYDLGKMRYNNGLNAFAGLDGGAASPDAGFMIDAKSACTSCHGAGEKSPDIEHTPQQTGGYSDQELVQIFTEAKKPEGVPFRTVMGMGAERWKTTHKWDMTTDEARGIVVYLRGMTPKAQGEVDFAAPLRRGHVLRAFCLPHRLHLHETGPLAQLRLHGRRAGSPQGLHDHRRLRPPYGRDLSHGKPGRLLRAAVPGPQALSQP
jgi:cytochrome c553